jgi:SAM-dependent methyltransferase
VDFDFRHPAPVSSPPPLTPLAAAVLHVGSPERVLQLACRDGDGALFLAREFPAARIRGIDADPDLVHAATARVGLDPEGRVAFKVGGPRRIPFPDDHFDLVAALDAKPKASELARVLRPGGHLILAAAEGDPYGRGPAAWLLARGLNARGFKTLVSERAGSGSFTVARLAGT